MTIAVDRAAAIATALVLSLERAQRDMRDQLRDALEPLLRAELEDERRQAVSEIRLRDE